MRRSGILLHITSLPSPYGVGTLGKAAFEFADFLHAARQTVWQVLPIGPHGLRRLALPVVFPHSRETRT